jgi:hypothetical protein
MVDKSKLITAPGIYIGLPEAIYHRSPALGSSDVRRILVSAPDYWWHSPMNPLRPADDPTPAMKFGRAVHKCVLEGTAAFTQLYAPCDYPGNIKAGIEERKRILADLREPIKRDEWDQIMLAHAMISKNPYLAEAFTGGVSEVSIFWEQDGILFKCRHDYMKIRATTDLKSIRNSRGIDFVKCCQNRFAEARYDIQAQHYMHGRSQMKRLYEAGLVFGDCDPDWLKRAATTKEFAFVYVYWQADGAPITWSMTLSPGNPILDIGRQHIEVALNRYKMFMERFGTDQAWVLADPPQELDLNDLPAWYARAA